MLDQFARIGDEVTGPAADDVDATARFPTETFDALRDTGLLGLGVPPELGGRQCTLTEVAHGVNVLARRCASTGLILAMHYSQLAVLAHHGRSESLRDLLRRCVRDQMLVANCNSEVEIAGHDRSSRAFVDYRSDGTYRLEKDTPVISYGEHADAIVITARRSVDAVANDQVLVACERPTMELTPRGTWDMLGLRGTCSRPFHLEAHGDAGMILSDPYETVVQQTGIGVTNVLFAAFWLGVAEGAAEIAHRWVRKDRNATSPYSSLRLAELASILQAVRDRTWSTTARWERVQGTEDAENLGTIVDLQGLKAIGTEAPAEIVGRAMRICGITSYIGGSPCHLGRFLRDAHGLALMASVDSALAQNAQMLLIRKSI